MYLFFHLALIVACFFSLQNTFATEGDCHKTLTPDSRFKLDGEVVYDMKTKLTWERCSEGQFWDGNTCAGKAEKFSWNDAVKRFPLGGKSWRLPNADELASILSGIDYDGNIPNPIESGCVAPAINKNVFVDGLEDWYWSGSVNANKSFSNNAWDVNFGTGKVKYHSRTDTAFVRLVRGELYRGPLSKSSKTVSYPEISTFLRREEKEEAEREKRNLATAQQRERENQMARQQACSNLYVGKAVKAPTTGIFGSGTERAVVIGFSSSSGMATVKSVRDSNMVGEVPCSSLE